MSLRFFPIPVVFTSSTEMLVTNCSCLWIVCSHPPSGQPCSFASFVSLILTSHGTSYFSARVKPETMLLKLLGNTVIAPVTAGPKLAHLMAFAVDLAYADAGVVLPVGCHAGTRRADGCLLCEKTIVVRFYR